MAGDRRPFDGVNSARLAETTRDVVSRVQTLRRHLPKKPTFGFPLVAPTVPSTVELPAEARRTGVDYDTSWARNFPSRLARTVILETLVQPTVALLAKPERRGLDRLEDLAQSWRDTDEIEPLIFAANHHSHLDSLMILSALPEPWRYRSFVGAGADYFFTNKVSSAASALALNAIPIEREGVSRKSITQCESLLRQKWSLVLFPEGGRSPDGWGQAHKPGAAWLAERTGTAVVPMYLAGTGRILPKGAKKLTPGRTILTFGTPLRCGQFNESEDARSFAIRIEAAISALADETSGDWYAARQRAHAEGTPALAGPQDASWRRAWALGDRKSKLRPPARRWPNLDS